MKKNLVIAFWFTLVTTVMFGILYPLAITGLAQVLFPKRANGQLIEKNGKTVGSRIIGKTFTESGYFRSRPSNAGTEYDATASSARSRFRPSLAMNFTVCAVAVFPTQRLEDAKFASLATNQEFAGQL